LTGYRQAFVLSDRPAREQDLVLDGAGFGADLAGAGFAVVVRDGTAFAGAFTALAAVFLASLFMKSFSFFFLLYGCADKSARAGRFVNTPCIREVFSENSMGIFRGI
jgi:hypothetical protein